jgi:hypothetical protein
MRPAFMRRMHVAPLDLRYIELIPGGHGLQTCIPSGGAAIRGTANFPELLMPSGERDLLLARVRGE